MLSYYATKTRFDLIPHLPRSASAWSWATGAHLSVFPPWVPVSFPSSGTSNLERTDNLEGHFDSVRHDLQLWKGHSGSVTLAWFSKLKVLLEVDHCYSSEIVQ